MRQIVRHLVAVAAIALAAGCAATKAGKAEDVHYSGFLSSYTGMTATGDSDFASFRYVKPGLDLSSYTGILVDHPVARMSDAARASIGDDDMAYLLGSFEHSLRETLGKKWNLVDAPGPGVLRIRSCVTDADSAIGVLTPFSRIFPWGVLISKGKQLVTGTAVNVGKASAEMEILDSESGEQLGAAVDRRVGTGVARLVARSWGDIDAAFDLWAERTAKRLAEYGLPTK